MVRERLSDSFPTGRLSVRQEFRCCLSSSEEPTSAKRQPSWASASRTALRFAEMARMVSRAPAANGDRRIPAEERRRRSLREAGWGRARHARSWYPLQANEETLSGRRD